MTTRLPGSTDQRRHRGRSPHVPTASVPILIVFFSGVVCRRFAPGCQRPIHGSCQKAGRWLAVSHLVAIDPTSTPCQRRCNGSSFGISFSTSPSLLIEIRCCSDQLRPPPKAEVSRIRKRRPRRTVLYPVFVGSFGPYPSVVVIIDPERDIEQPPQKTEGGLF